MQRREAPKSWPRHAGECCHSLALRARRAPQDNPLARTACFGRAAPPGAPPRFLAQAAGPPRLKNRTRSIRRLKSAGGVLPSEILIRSLCNYNRDDCQEVVASIVTTFPGRSAARSGALQTRDRHGLRAAEAPRSRRPRISGAPLARCTASGERLRRHPRNGARLTGPSNKPPISFSASAARASLQPPCLALSRNLSSMSARVSGSCAPPRI